MSEGYTPVGVTEPTRESDSPRMPRWASRAGIVVLIILGAASKTAALDSLAHHPATLFVVFGVIALLALRHGRLITTAWVAAVIVAVAVSPGSIGLGIAFGVGAFAALMALFVGIGTVLHALDAHASGRARR